MIPTVNEKENTKRKEKKERKRRSEDEVIARSRNQTWQELRTRTISRQKENQTRKKVGRLEFPPRPKFGGKVWVGKVYKGGDTLTALEHLSRLSMLHLLLDTG